MNGIVKWIIKCTSAEIADATNLLKSSGGEYRNRTGVHGFAIQKDRQRKQQLKGAKHPLTKSEQKAKVSTIIARQNAHRNASNLEALQ